MTEMETFKGWLIRAGIKFSTDQEQDGGVDFVVEDSYTEARVSFDANGSFTFLGSGEI